MVWVNLLPWRQATLRQRARLWGLLTLGGILLLTGLLLIGQAQRSLNQQQAGMLAGWRADSDRAMQLKARTAAAQLELEGLRENWNLQQQRRRHLLRWQRFAQTLGEQMPSDLWLRQLVKSDRSLEIGGFAKSIDGVHQLREQLGTMPLFHLVTLGTIQRNRDQALQFAMQAQFADAREQDDD